METKNKKNQKKKIKNFPKKKPKPMNSKQQNERPSSNNEPHGEEKEQIITQPKMYNLSITTLSRHQISILLLDLKLTPTPTINNIHLKSNIYIPFLGN